jgi:hypothetical protein
MSPTPLAARPRVNARRRIASIVTAAAVTAMLLVVPNTAAEARAAKVTICHQVGNLSYRVITVDVNAVSGGGHGHHSGDIIPAVNARQGNRDIHFPGRNLGTVLRADGLTGAQVVANGCNVPPVATTAQLTTPTSAVVATPTPVDTLAPTPTTAAVPTPTGSAVPTTGVQTTLAPNTTNAPPTPTATPAPQPTLAPTPTTAAVPTPTGSAVPTTGVQTTLAPNTTNAPPTPTATPAPQPTLAPTPTSAPSPTLAPNATPSPTPPTAPEPTLAPSRTVAPDTTAAANCPDGELAHGGECFAVPPLVIPPTPSLLTITSQPESASLTPIVECVDNRSDGVSVVWFNYESTADDAVTVERGPANQVSPRGTPPTLFGPGLHIFVLAVETTDGVASWTLAGETATSSADSRDCSAPLTTGTPDTTDPGTPDTTDPGTTGTTDPGTTDTTDPGTTGTTDPATTDTTEPGNETATSTGACAPGETGTDGDCSPVEPVRLVLVDNVLECDGHGVARFAAFNDNVFALEADNATSLVSPARLAADAPEVIAERDVVSDDGSETAALFTVRYVTAVTWTVAHHGLEASISAGANGASTNPDCPDAIVASSGAHGLLSAPGPLATTGPDDALPVAVLAALLSALGLGLVMAARRRPSAVR